MRFKVVSNPILSWHLPRKQCSLFCRYVAESLIRILHLKNVLEYPMLIPRISQLELLIKSRWFLRIKNELTNLFGLKRNWRSDPTVRLLSDFSDFLFSSNFPSFQMCNPTRQVVWKWNWNLIYLRIFILFVLFVLFFWQSSAPSVLPTFSNKTREEREQRA